MLFSQSIRNILTGRLRRLFGGAPVRIQAAALPWRERDEGIEIMLITSRGTGRWVLPKGWPEGEERLFETARREAAEEAGLDGEIAQDEAGCYVYGKVLSSGLARRCEVHVYPLKVGRIARKWPEKGQRKRRWVSPSDAAMMVDEGDLRQVISAFGANPRKFAA